jgi:hypothetical protein
MTITNQKNIKVIENTEGEDFENQSLQYTDFISRDLRKANFINSLLCHATFTEANLEEATFAAANLEGANLMHANLKKASLTRAYLRKATLTSAILVSSDLRFTNFEEANLQWADLSGADLTGANLSGAKLRDVNLRGAIGLGTKAKEIAFAKKLLKTLQKGLGELVMDEWHTCQTAHCLAGWRLPKERVPGQQASLLCPTLAQFFYASESEALERLRLVASGELSVFPD